jgi:hypothetical protein
MGFSLSRGCQIFCLLALAAFQAGDSFVPNSRAFHVAKSEYVRDRQQVGFLPSSCPSETALSMGVMEKFVTGMDEKTRKTDSDKYVLELQKRVNRINELEQNIEDLGDEELQAKTEEFKARLQKGEDINGPLLEEAFAVVREAAWCVFGSFS